MSKELTKKKKKTLLHLSSHLTDSSLPGACVACLFRVQLLSHGAGALGRHVPPRPAIGVCPSQAGDFD